MTENYLHHLWKFNLLNLSNCKTECGEEIKILDFGFHNQDSGPDFYNGKVKIGNTIWAGNIEIHINSSDWKKHNHQIDKAYDNVILHVVYNYDCDVETTNGSIIPTFELKNRIDYSKYEEYEQFIFNKIPCFNSLENVSEIIISNTIERNLIERLTEKSNEIKEVLKRNNNNWEQTFFQFMCKSLGMKVNSIPMEELAQNTPFTIFNKLGDNILAIESVLFGQAGMLAPNSRKDKTSSYFNSLQKEYQFQKIKNNLVSVNEVSWKFSKLRPSNFPTIRLTQLAQLIYKNNTLFNSFVNDKITIKEIQEKLSISIQDGFWHNHYTFEKESKEKKKSFGKVLINSLIINTISPFLFVYGKYKAEEKYCEKAMELLEKIPAEDNRIVRQFDSKIAYNSSFETQGMIQLFHTKCLEKKCLECGIGVSLMK